MLLPWNRQPQGQQPPAPTRLRARRATRRCRRSWSKCCPARRLSGPRAPVGLRCALGGPAECLHEGDALDHLPAAHTHTSAPPPSVPRADPRQLLRVMEAFWADMKRQTAAAAAATDASHATSQQQQQQQQHPPPPEVVRREPPGRRLDAAPDVDVVVAGGTLGVLLALSLQARGHTVAVVERRRLQGRNQGVLMLSTCSASCLPGVAAASRHCAARHPHRPRFSGVCALQSGTSPAKSWSSWCSAGC